MKEKLLVKEVETVTESAVTEIMNGKASTVTTRETKTETDGKIDQETICANLNNLAGCIPSLADIDVQMLSDETQEKLKATKENIINAMYRLSVHLAD
jgi:hypothetical protein